MQHLWHHPYRNLAKMVMWLTPEIAAQSATHLDFPSMVNTLLFVLFLDCAFIVAQTQLPGR